MSAFVVSKTHIDVLITAGLSRRTPQYPGDSDPPLRWLLPFQRTHDGATTRGELTAQRGSRRADALGQQPAQHQLPL